MPRISRRSACILLLTCLGLYAGQDSTYAQIATGAMEGRWRQVKVQGPAARWGHVAAYDPHGSRLLMFGGSGAQGELGDLWEFSLKTETWREIPQSGLFPSPRFTAGVVSDPPRQRMLLVGGYTGHASSNEVWAFAFTTNRWSRLASGPSARFDLAMAVGSDKAWAYGGFKSFDEFQALGDLWELDLTTDTWRQLPGGQTQPAPRTNLTFGFDAPSHKLYIFGGHDQHPPPLTDTWSYDFTTSSWAQVRPGGEFPDAVTHQAYVFDAACRALLMMGGDHNDKKDVSSMWALNMEPLSFVRIRSEEEPPRRQHSVMVMDSRGRLVVFGGREGDRLLSDTWIFERAKSCS